ncbi:MAG: M20 metallopeptidase family protein [Spirochaetota bacterium]
MITAETVRRLADELYDDTVRVRRTIHRTPELSFDEERTAAFVADELSQAGIPYTCGIGGHGVVATIAGDAAFDRAGAPVVALRADMDALPIGEENDHGFCSTVEGVMHACGHDGHTASLLTTGRILARLRGALSGTVRLIFQPAEERAPGGAQAMIGDGALESPRVQSVFGQHVNPDLPVGTVGFNPGLFMASADDLAITVRGRGGHAAKPHDAVDPIAIASQLIVTLQQVVSRFANPITPSVLTFGRFVAEGAINVIPETAELAGTFRTVDERWRDRALAEIEAISRDLVASLGATAQVEILRGYPPVVNDADATTLARERAVEYLGEGRVVDLPPAMWAEDFAYFAKERPACFYNLGVRNESRGIVHPVHSSRFDLDEEALRVGSGLMAWIALGALERTL